MRSATNLLPAQLSQLQAVLSLDAVWQLTTGTRVLGPVQTGDQLAHLSLVQLQEE